MNSEQSKFSILRARRQDDFHAEDYNTKPFVFDGIQKEVYDNANLSIFVNESCNANCKFCVDQLRFEGKGKKFVKSRIQNLLKTISYVFNKFWPPYALSTHPYPLQEANLLNRLAFPAFSNWCPSTDSVRESLLLMVVDFLI